jgi:hypothetical protein
MQDAGSNLEASEKKGKDILKSLGDALESNFSVAAVGKVVAELDAGASQLLKQFGLGQQMAQTLSATMADAVSSVRVLGGDIKDVIETQRDASKELGRNVVLSAEVNKDLYATMKVTGEQIGPLVKGFKDAGYGAGQVAKEMKNVVDIAAQSGVNAQKVSSAVLQNMDSLSKYNFEGGVSGLAKMAAQAAMLRIDMKTTLGFAEKVFDPEGAIEMAAAMQRLGVTQSSLLDPLKLMDLAQNDPAELQNQMAEMGKSFTQLNEKGQFEIMPGAKRQMRELEKAMGLPAGELAKMSLASAELEDKMSKIRFPELPELDEDKQKMIANMAEMGAGGKYEVQVTDPETGKTVAKAIDELNAKDVANLEKMANTAPKTMEELAKEQLSTLESIAADIKSLADKPGLALAGSKSMTGVQKYTRAATTSARKVLSPKELDSKNLRGTIDTGIDRSLDTLKRLTDGEITAAEARKEVGENLSKLNTLIKSAFQTGMNIAKEEGEKLNKDFPNVARMEQLMTGKMKGVSSAKKESSDANPMNVKRDISNVRNTSTMSTNEQQSSNSNTTKTPIEITLNHNVDLKTNGNVDTNQIVMALKNTDVQQGIVMAIKEGMFSNGLLAPTANKTQLMNSNLSSTLTT